ncbi:2OG-Fe(II) oxygenase [Pseudoalteromonas sp. S16_S37]|uniref:2OG-Fe(II) oxygenase n=1 Tax=Pseudoalteromonas sp. S16_S37 TaxID=2720228 RepID=UPI00168003AD|nr:2OG-Fe(II) oxygenase [Pseudoalteromonas sp. S16_S37]MBD1583315.1 hypothetical protein [Pseudoalteromonas sp. S16_S37]
MASIINYDALSQAKVSAPELPYSTYSGVFNREIPASAFPSDHFEFHSQRKLLEALGKKGTPAWYQHNVRTRTLLELGQSEVFSPQTLDSIWLDVAQGLLSKEYRQSISEAAQFDVSKLEFQAHFWEFGQGSYFQPHVDKPHKKVTHLMYLTENWTPDVGGELNILRSKSKDDVIKQIPPINNNAVVLHRTDNAWHSVNLIPHESPVPRRLLQVWFWSK